MHRHVPSAVQVDRHVLRNLREEARRLAEEGARADGSKPDGGERVRAIRILAHEFVGTFLRFGSTCVWVALFLNGPWCGFAIALIPFSLLRLWQLSFSSELSIPNLLVYFPCPHLFSRAGNAQDHRDPLVHVRERAAVSASAAVAAVGRTVGRQVKNGALACGTDKGTGRTRIRCIRSKLFMQCNTAQYVPYRCKFIYFIENDSRPKEFISPTMVTTKRQRSRPPLQAF